MTDQLTKAEAFKAFHTRPQPLLLPNPWDVGSAKYFAHLGFEALASTSLGQKSSEGDIVANADAILSNLKASATPRICRLMRI